jgi:hypothetical protein
LPRESRTSSSIRAVRFPLREVFIVATIVSAALLAFYLLVDDEVEQELYSPIDFVNNPVYSRRNIIEKEYPEFRYFEQQDSFAGTSVVYEAVGSDYYFAYLLHGSGLPIARATCFRVDRAGRVFKVGEFPDLLDSYAGYPGIDPKDCSGIRPSLQ